MTGSLSSAEEDGGMVEQGAVGCPNLLQLVNEAGHAGAKHFVPATQGDDVGVVRSAVAAPFVVDVMGAAKLGSGFVGPDLVVVVVWASFSAKDTVWQPASYRFERPASDRTGYCCDARSRGRGRARVQLPFRVRHWLRARQTQLVPQRRP